MAAALLQETRSGFGMELLLLLLQKKAKLLEQISCEPLLGGKLKPRLFLFPPVKNRSNIP